MSGLIDSRESSGPARLRYFDWVVGTLRRAGFTLEMAARAFSLLDSYIYGFGRQQLNMSAGSDIKPEEMAEAFLRAIPAGEYPYLREMVVEYAMSPATMKAPTSNSGSTSFLTDSRGFWTELRARSAGLICRACSTST